MDQFIIQNSYNSFTDISLLLDDQKKNELYKTYTIYYDKFINIMYLKTSGKLAINNQNNIYIQNWRPWRFIIRKIYRQSTLLSLIYIDQNMAEYVKYINIIIDLKDTLMDTFITLLNSNYNLVNSILPSIISLRTCYTSESNHNVEHCTYLESIYNQLSRVNKQLKAEIDYIKFNKIK